MFAPSGRIAGMNRTERRAELERVIRGAGEEGENFIVLVTPQDLGEDYDEVIQNPERVAESRLGMWIIPTSERHKYRSSIPAPP
jgi:hypothetical protein